MILFNHIIYLLQILQVVKEKSMALLYWEKKVWEKKEIETLVGPTPILTISARII